MKIILLGTGLRGSEFLNCVHAGATDMRGGGSVEIVAVFDHSPDVAGTLWNGYQVKHESELKAYLEKQSDDTKIVIASMCVDPIVERLGRRGIDPAKCYVVNLYRSTPYHDHDADIISFSDIRYQELEDMLETDSSKHVLNSIKECRGNDHVLMIPAEELRGDFLDYWITVKPFRRFDKAVVIDGGAFTGESIEPLCSAIGPGIVHYYAFEPDKESYEKLAKRPRFDSLYGELSTIQRGLWSVETELRFDENAERKIGARISNEGTKKIVTQAIDTMEIEAETDIFIKMDIEGSELEALKGAEKLIRERKPSLAICLYHKENDMIEIPFYLKSLVPEYKLHLCGGAHTICIAQIEK